MKSFKDVRVNHEEFEELKIYWFKSKLNAMKEWTTMCTVGTERYLVAKRLSDFPFIGTIKIFWSYIPVLTPLLLFFFSNSILPLRIKFYEVVDQFRSITYKIGAYRIATMLIRVVFKFGNPKKYSGRIDGWRFKRSLELQTAENLDNATCPDGARYDYITGGAKRNFRKLAALSVTQLKAGTANMEGIDKTRTERLYISFGIYNQHL